MEESNKNAIYCAHCGERIDDEDYEEFDGEIWCDACLYENTVRCDRCGERIHYNDAVQDDDTTLCQGCFDDYYSRCEHCGRIVHDEDVNWHNDYPYCDSCFEDFDNEIAEYSFKPDPIFYGDGRRFFGIELEIDHGDKDDENARILKGIANAEQEHIYVKSDGLLDDGMGLVTHPMTLDYHKNFCWEEIMRKAISLGYDDSSYYNMHEEILLAYCGCYGVDSADVELLLEYGYTCDEIEDMLADQSLLHEALMDVKYMCGESLYESCYGGI